MCFCMSRGLLVCAPLSLFLGSVQGTYTKGGCLCVSVLYSYMFTCVGCVFLTVRGPLCISIACVCLIADVGGDQEA